MIIAVQLPGGAGRVIAADDETTVVHYWQGDQPAHVAALLYDDTLEALGLQRGEYEATSSGRSVPISRAEVLMVESDDAKWAQEDSAPDWLKEMLIAGDELPKYCKRAPLG